MEKNDMKSIMSSALLNSMEIEEPSPELKAITDSVAGMFAETMEHFNKPRTGKLPADAIRDVFREAAEKAEDEEETE